MTYDWRADSYQSWLLAIRELRLQGVREGRFDPINDAERAVYGIDRYKEIATHEP